MVEKLVVCIMGQNCERFIGMCLDSVKNADAIVYCDGGSEDATLDIVEDFKLNNMEWTHIEGEGSIWNWHPNIIKNEYNQEDKNMNGKQRNFYLKHLKENYPNDWALCLDADEVVEDLDKIKEFINKMPPCVASVKMRHFIGDLGHEDATVPEHYVLNRLFKISEADYYPEVEHPVLIAKNTAQVLGTNCTTIWHLAYIPNLWEIKNRYDNHLKKSNMHTPEFLKQWYYSHLFGFYPKADVPMTDIPEIILNRFGINKDEFYFSNRGIEAKHFIDAYHWKEFFNLNGKLILEVGCGLGPRVLAMNMMNLMAEGIELSQYAVEHTLIKNKVKQGDVLTMDEKDYDLVIAYDLLEHINYKDIDKAIDNLKNATNKHILISVPVIGDLNLENDKTHKIKETKEWWINKFIGHKLIPIDVPEYFLFNNQLIILIKEEYTEK